MREGRYLDLIGIYVEYMIKEIPGEVDDPEGRSYTCGGSRYSIYECSLPHNMTRYRNSKRAPREIGCYDEAFREKKKCKIQTSFCYILFPFSRNSEAASPALIRMDTTRALFRFKCLYRSRDYRYIY